MNTDSGNSMLDSNEYFIDCDWCDGDDPGCCQCDGSGKIERVC